MDTLRATNLSSILSTHQDNKQTKNGVNMDKDNVLKLVKIFGELSKHEKILFLINIREFTKGNVAVSMEATGENKADVPVAIAVW